MANINMTMSSADYARIMDAFLYTFIPAETSAKWTNQQKKTFLDGKINEYVRGVVVAAEKSKAVAVVPNPTPPDISIS